MLPTLRSATPAVRFLVYLHWGRGGVFVVNVLRMKCFSVVSQMEFRLPVVAATWPHFFGVSSADNRDVETVFSPYAPFQIRSTYLFPISNLFHRQTWRACFFPSTSYKSSAHQKKRIFVFFFFCFWNWLRRCRSHRSRLPCTLRIEMQVYCFWLRCFNFNLWPTRNAATGDAAAAARCLSACPPLLLLFTIFLIHTFAIPREVPT